MKRLFTTAALAALLAGPVSAETLKLVEVITSPQRTETLKGIVAEFEAANPGTTVEIISLPWGEAFQKFATMVSAGDIPDVIEMPDTWVSLYAGNGLLADLSPYLAEWEHTDDLSERAVALGQVDDKPVMLPYGFYLRAMFYNKDLLAEAGVEEVPTTIDEFRAAAEKVSALPGKAGYCMRGGPGGLNGWVMFPATVAGDNVFFDEEGNSTYDSEGWVEGLTWFIDLYKDGLAPKDSVNWGFNEIVAGFYTGQCAFLDQDPDALIAIAERMKPEQYGVTTFPKGPSGKAFPTIGYAGWSLMEPSEHKDLAWKLIATLEGPEGNVPWNKMTGALPALKSAENDPFYQSEAFKGWFDELADPDVEPTTMPTWLEEFAFFKDSLAISSGQKALLGEITPEELAAEWADYLTKAQQKYISQ
ncbi:MAG TPA: sugar ABC transporter substrate-binding protein [Amaricoccus sp.]|uniref:ABC transporter substrate-binding protein n=1 Tax=Amaricoccus sp. TaxID=1872485 RepID=UPI002C8FEC2A|nr:sugar ABC transporter substrate-binding protein [Amaricoccus sp.]HMQ94804.1 sugar ABC transporter substrate-binding protein [Amaricoccus sp.]HMR54776.1 sugar ABC transporter substrate-binding protein [Amaricoccus sp.]HMR60974.1 sugar ABC transporter substrate-binding protein [Amaricoccus sp.]HMU01791.1 sugar ABC transporter substrate-binding protein [Amaricoccus sp.]